MNKILEVLKGLAADKRVRAAAVALAMAIAAYFGIGCASLSPAQQRALQAHQCYIAALEPALGELAVPVLQALLAGGNPVQALAVHGLSEREIVATLQAFSDCAVQASVAPRPVDLDPASGVDL